MATATPRRVALMAIHPEYAEAILDGRKTVEFRKRPLASDIHSVLIYATSPVKKIVGHFFVEEIVSANPREVWRRYGDLGCIDASNFDLYFASADTAYAIRIKTACPYIDALPLSALNPQPAVPQSFAYLDCSTVDGLCADLDDQMALFEVNASEGALV